MWCFKMSSAAERSKNSQLLLSTITEFRKVLDSCICWRKVRCRGCKSCAGRQEDYKQKKLLKKARVKHMLSKDLMGSCNISSTWEMNWIALTNISFRLKHCIITFPSSIKNYEKQELFLKITKPSNKMSHSFCWFTESNELLTSTETKYRCLDSFSRYHWINGSNRAWTSPRLNTEQPSKCS